MAKQRKRVPQACECGCGETTRGGRFKQGHSSRVNRDPERDARHMAMMRAKVDESVRIEATKAAYENMSVDGKQKFSDHATRLWTDERDKMMEAVKKGGRTFSERLAANGGIIGKRDERWRDKISKSITERYIGGGWEWSKGHYTSSKSGKTLYYRSSWELRRMRELDSDPGVGSWDFEPFSIPYVLDGRTRRYVPDFIIRHADGSVVLEEVGPKSLKRSSEINAAKSQAARAYCDERGYAYRVWQPT